MEHASWGSEIEITKHYYCGSQVSQCRFIKRNFIIWKVIVEKIS